MASGATLKGSFSKWATKAEKKEATCKDITRWCTDAGVFGKNCSSNNLDIAFSKVKPKGKTTISVKELEPLIDEISKAYAKDKHCEQDEAKSQLKEKLKAAEPKLHGATKAVKAGGVDRLTDTTKYTGSHKERFDESGKGKGKEGRENTVDNSGYVGNYKGKDTFDKKE